MRCARSLAAATPRDAGCLCRPGLQLVTGDAVSGVGLRRRCAGVDVAYYLIHSMEPGG